MWIPIGSIPDANISADEKIDLVAIALEEWSIAQALCIIHGKERGIDRYIQAGGSVRFNAESEPCIWHDPTTMGQRRRPMTI